MPSNHLILCHPLLLLSIFPSIRIFPNESALHIRWPKYWSFSFNISPSNEYSGLISFRMDWLYLPYHWSPMKGTFCYIWKYSGFYSFISSSSSFFFFFLFVSSSWPFGFVTGLIFARASLLAQLVKNLHKMLENWVQSLGWEDPLEKGKATHSSMLAWRIPWTVYPMRSQRIRQDWVTLTQLIFAHTVWNWWQVGFSGDFSPADSPSRYMLFLALTPETQPWH